MNKLHRKVSGSAALFAATLVVVVAMAMVIGVTGVASAASAGGQGVRSQQGARALLYAHRALAHRLDAERRLAHAAIVGGNQISIEQAPWQIVMFGFVEEEEELVGVLLCGGSILDATHVVTAGHCLYNPETGLPLPADDVVVVAGVSDLEAEHEENAQFRLAANLRIHPYFDYAAGAGAPDDVAVIGLSEGLLLSSAPGSAVGSIGMIGASTTLAEGTQLNLTGYGRENPDFEPTGELNSIGMTVGYPRKCGGEDDAVFVCGSTASGSACFGDSGSGLTTTGGSPALAGVMDIVFGVDKEFCRDGSTNGFVNLDAPEIRDFVEGDESPPQAPRGGEAIEVRGVPKVGHSLTCSPGNWSGDPSITYFFIDSANGEVLQAGASSTYTLTESDVGRTIYCEVQATNDGGTGVVRTGSLRAIEALPVEQNPPPESHLPAPPPPPPPPAPAPAPAPAPGTGGSESGGSGAGDESTPTAPTGSGGVEAAKIHSEGVALMGTTLNVQSGGSASAKLDCKEAENCSGILTLLAKRTIKARKGSRKTTTRTVKIGVANFTLEAGQTAIEKIHLNAAGRALLGADGGHLPASLKIEESEVHTWTDGVQLVAAPPKAKGSHRKKG